MYTNPVAVFRDILTQTVEEAAQSDKQLIADKLLPIHNVPERMGLYPKRTIIESGLMKAKDTKRERHAAYGEASESWTWDKYRCEDYGLEEPIDDADAGEMKKFWDLEKITSKSVDLKVRRAREQEAAALLMNESTFAKTSPTVNYKAANKATIDPVQDFDNVLAVMEGYSIQPEEITVTMTRDVINLLRQSSILIEFAWGKFGDTVVRRPIDAKIIKELWGFKEVIIAAAKVDVSKTKGAKSLTNIWGNDYILFTKVAGGDFSNGGVGRTLLWSEFNSGSLTQIMTYRDEKHVSDRVRSSSFRDHKIIDPLNGHLLDLNWGI